MNKPNHKATPRLIVNNKKATHDYHIEQRYEAGLVLEGWEVKSIRAGRVQLRDSYVVFKNGEPWLIGMHISPLETVSTHIHPDAQRTRKLLLSQHEIGKLFGAVQREGYTAIPLDLHWHKKFVKVELALGKGKKTHDKRQTIKDREWQREKHRTLKNQR